MEKYNVTGMSCASCVNHVTKAVMSVKGVTDVSVNLLTNSMIVYGNAHSKQIIKAVKDAGYNASIQTNDDLKDIITDKESPEIINRLILSIGFLLIEMYLSMGVLMFGFPVFEFIKPYQIIYSIIAMLTLIVMIINKKFFISGFKGIIHKAPNMDTLVALGSFTSFIYSFVWLIKLFAEINKISFDIDVFKNNFFFDSAAMILVLISVGKLLESKSKGKTKDALKNLILLKPEYATVLDGDIERQIKTDELKPDDIFIVKPGGKIPTDGIVISGNSSVDESVLTGESIPVEKSLNSKVFAGTFNTSGVLKCKVTGIGQDTVLSGIIRLVKEGTSTKAPIARIADKVASVFVPVVLIIAIITFIIWKIILNADMGNALTRAISVLVVSCPCALGLATPVAIMVANGVGARNGILFKTSESLEECGKIKYAAFDKTGTLTEGYPEVKEIIETALFNKDELLKYAASIEINSTHPFAKAIISAYNSDNYYASKDFAEIPGMGSSCIIEDKTVKIGNAEFVNANENTLKISGNYLNQGASVVYLSVNNTVSAIFVFEDRIKEEANKAISQIYKLGIHPVMISGDNKLTALNIAKSINIKDCFSEIKPAGKTDIIKQIRNYGKTIMIGDGINDAPALVNADLGMSIGNGTDIAIDAADIVLINNSLLSVASAIRLSRKTISIIKENLFWAFAYNIINIPLAAGVFIPFTGLTISPMFGAFAMSLSSIIVCLNSLRLNLFDIHNDKNDKKIFNTDINFSDIIRITEDLKMNKTYNIEGMMCPHCSGHVKEAILKIDGVTDADVSHETGKAIVYMSKDIPDSEIINAVNNAGYKVI